jgi:hypothetical protein
MWTKEDEAELRVSHKRKEETYQALRDLLALPVPQSPWEKYQVVVHLGLNADAVIAALAPFCTEYEVTKK